MPIDYYGAHSIVFIHSQTFAFDDIVPPASEKNYYHSWLDFHMVPAVRPHIETPEAEIIMYSDTVSSKVFDLTNARLGFQKFSSLKGQWEFIIDHDRWTDWVTAKAEIEDYFNGRRIMCALMDDPTVAYFGRAFLSNWDDGEDYSRATIDYDLNYEPKVIDIDFLKPVSITASLKSDAPSFYRRESTSDIIPYVLAVATYGNGRQENVKIDYISPSTFDAVGKTTLDVAYRGYLGTHTNIEIDVKEDEIVKLKAEYVMPYSPIVGDVIDGIRGYINFRVTYKSCTTELHYGGDADYISGVYSYAGKQYVTITYKGYTTTLEVVVIEVTISRVDYAYKTNHPYEFGIGGNKDLVRQKIYLIITYENGYIRVIDGTNAESISGTFEHKGSENVTLYYRGFAIVVPVTVIDVSIESIAARFKSDAPSVFVAGDIKDKIREFIDIEVAYNNGSVNIIDGSNADSIDGTFTTSGQQAVTITYKEKSAAITVNVVTPLTYQFSVDTSGNTTITTINQKGSGDTITLTNGDVYNVTVPNGTAEAFTYGFTVSNTGDILITDLIREARSKTLTNGDSFDLTIASVTN